MPSSITALTRYCRMSWHDPRRVLATRAFHRRAFTTVAQLRAEAETWLVDSNHRRGNHGDDFMRGRPPAKSSKSTGPDDQQPQVTASTSNPGQEALETRSYDGGADPAVDQHVDAVDPARIVGEKERDHGRNLVGAALPSE